MKWVSWTNVVLGLWLLVAPFLLGYGTLGAVVAEDIGVGIFIAGLATWRALGGERGLSWTVAILGLWLLAGPFWLGYGTVTAAMSNDVIVGLLVACLGAWRAMAAEPAVVR